jgi:hypothetical protein
MTQRRGYHLKPETTKAKPRGPSARATKGRSTTAAQAAQPLSSAASEGSGAATAGPSDEEGAGMGMGGDVASGCVNPETDGGLARGVMAHVLELLR